MGGVDGAALGAVGGGGVAELDVVVDVVGGQDERADVSSAEALCGLDEPSEGEG